MASRRVDDYVFGFVHREVEHEREREGGGMGLDEFSSRSGLDRGMLATGRYPYLQRYTEEGGLPPPPRRFEEASTGC